MIHEPSLDDGPLRLTARSLLDGKILWTTTHPGEGRRPWIQAFDDGHLLVRVENELQLVNVQAGSVEASYAGHRGTGRHLWRQRDVCLLSSECGVDVIDCDSAKPLRSFRIGHSTRRRIGENRPSRCFGGVNIVGRSGQTLIISMNNWQTDEVPRRAHSRTGANAWIGIDAESGAIRWRAQHGCTHCVGTETGVIGELAWFQTEAGLTLLDGATGETTLQIPAPNLREVFVEHAASKLLLLLPSSLIRVDPLNGEQTWDHSIENGALAATEGARHPGSRLEADHFLWLNQEGEVLYSTAVAEGSFIHPGPQGGRWLVGETARFDSVGQRLQLLHFRVVRGTNTQRANVRWADHPPFFTFERDAWRLSETVLPAPPRSVATLTVFESAQAPSNVGQVHPFRSE